MRCEAPRETLRLVYPDERRSAHRIPRQRYAKQSRGPDRLHLDRIIRITGVLPMLHEMNADLKGAGAGFV